MRIRNSEIWLFDDVSKIYVRDLAQMPRFNPKSVLILLKQVRPQHTAVEEITNLGQKERAYPWELRIWACEGAQLLSFWPFYQTGRLLPSCCCCSSHRCTVLPRWSKKKYSDFWFLDSVTMSFPMNWCAQFLFCYRIINIFKHRRCKWDRSK